MERAMKYAAGLWMAVIVCLLSSCADEIANPTEHKDGTLLNLYMQIEGAVNTRLAELPHDQIGMDARGHMNVGLYIYYEDDYKKGDLTKPYIRNLEMTYDEAGSKLVPANVNATQEIYIYDRMTIVALYPYNATVKDFTDKNSEESYYISESDYRNQLYIPYRAQTEVNPTNAYTARLGFGPKQTCKVQIVLTSTDPKKFPTYDASKNKSLAGDASITILPGVDPIYAGEYNNVDRREQWIDSNDELPGDKDGSPVTPVGGKYVRRYNAYLWTTKKDLPHHDDKEHWNNIINKGDILFHSDKLTLVVPATVDLSEQKVYRYGYDLDNGEMFIPTSESLIYDVTSFMESTGGTTYQVCDIDLSTVTPWKPKDLYDAHYDGGGHQIKGLQIDGRMTASADDKNPTMQAFGLFNTVSGKSTLKNIHLVSPKITVNGDAGKDTCYVGSLCGLLNPELSDKDREEKIWKGLPPELSETVRKALLAEAMRSPAITTSTIEGCKVENPQITVTNASVVVAGGFCGGAGNQKQVGNITESYLAQTDNGTSSFIKVHNDDTDWKSHATIPFAGSFCGLLANGEIQQSYTTMSQNVTAFYNKKSGTTDAKSEAAVAFCYQVAGQKVTNCRTTMTTGATTVGPTGNKNVTIEIPAVPQFTASWPSDWSLFFVKDQDGNPSNSPFNKWPCVSWTHYWVDLGSSPATYPTLMWEYKPYFINE